MSAPMGPDDVERLRAIWREDDREYPPEMCAALRECDAWLHGK